MSDQPSEPEVMWNKFVELMEEQDGFRAMNFIGGIEKYRTIFLEANKGHTCQQKNK